MTTITKTYEYNTSSEDFPLLGAMAPKAKEKKTISPGKSSGKGIEITDLMGFTSHLDELKAARRHGGGRGRGRGRGPVDAKRAEAYEKLQDKGAMAKRQTQTRLCWSVQKGVRCPHGENCNFAHTKDALWEGLCAAPCLFGERCHFVRWSRGGSYHNNRSSQRKCIYLHPEETRENYMRRTGMDKIELKVPALPTKSDVIELVPVQVMLNALTKKAEARALALPPKESREELTYAACVVGDSGSSPVGSALLSRKRAWAQINSRGDEMGDEMGDGDEPGDEMGDGDEMSDEMGDGDEPDDPEPVTYSVPEAIAIDTLKAAIAAGHKTITLTIF